MSSHEDIETSNTNSCYSTPKLSLSNLPNKPRNNNNINNTPPLHPSLSIPFQWEEAPGKPKSPTTTTKSKTARSLHLPPRLTLLLLMNNEAGKITNTPSPTTVLNGPYVGRSFSCVNEATVQKKKEEIDKDDTMMMRSWRWQNLNENNRGVVVKGNFDFSDPLSSCNSSLCDFDETNQRKELRFTRKGSFFNFSRTNSNLLGEIYESVKKAVPWRWRRSKTKRAL